MGGEEVIELSVEETNKLRAELGLAPLRLNNNKNDVDEKQQHQEPQEMTTTSSGDNNNNNNTKEGEGGEEVLEMSIDETNRLRAKLGLKPLRTGDDDDKAKKDKIIHKPAVNDEKANEMKQKLEHARLKRDVDRGVVKTFGSSTLADTNDDEDNNNDNNNNTLSWADRMRKQQEGGEENGTTKDDTKKKKKKKKGSSSKKKGSSGGNDDNGDGGNYTSKELEGVHVAHNLTELQSGSTTVLTLADASILDTTGGGGNVGLNENDVALENVNLQEQKKTKDGLRKKRLLELGMGRAGGYSGFDDEEFEELGGTLGPARKERGGNPDYEDDDDEGGPKSKGFTIGSSETTAADQKMSDLDKISSGKAISLRPTKADVVASDYMTIEEEQKEAEERAKKKKKKDGKFKKNKKKKDKKKKRRGRTATVDSDDDEEAEGSGANNAGVVNNANEQKNANSLLEQLEKTAGNEEETTNTNLRKRRRSESEDEEDGGGDDGKAIVKQEDGNHQQQQEGPKQKRSRYEEIMQKGNERTKLAFQDPKPKEENTNSDIDEPDDSFLNAALEKARRLNRLRELNQKRKKGAEVVADAVQSIVKQEEEQQQQSNKNEASSGTLTFAIDDTREFTRALRARSQQNERKTQQKAKQQRDDNNKEEEQEKKAADPSSSDVKVEDVPVDGDDEEDVDMEELAKEVKIDHDDTPGFGDATASATGVGRGLSSFVSMLKQTGEINTKRGNKEELRGRAKDERNYENYEEMDLSKVVKIGRNATDKDKEMAEREIKLEYRDKYGRLLTQKAAYRELCYQFHGHGSNKKNEEKQLRQIERERAEGRLASRQVVAAREGTAAGTLGALKATQKATGKAFIVHKT